MIAFSAHFDGKVIVPDQAVDLPLDKPFVVRVETAIEAGSNATADLPVPSLQWLAENAVDDDLPADLAAEHDHYLYGTVRRS